MNSKDNFGCYSCVWLMKAIVVLIIFIGFTNGQKTLHYSIREEEPPGVFLANLADSSGLTDEISPQDLGKIRFEFLKGGSSIEELFNLDVKTGILETSKSIDRDVLCPYKRVCDIDLNVQVTPIEFYKLIKVRITLIDINDNAPIFSDSTIIKHLSESSKPGTTKISLPIANDPDGPQFGIVRYKLVPDGTVFRLEDGSHGVDDLQLVLEGDLDRELVESYNLEVFAIDGGTPPMNGSIRVNIYVVDVNDNIPHFDNTTYDVVVREDIELRTVVLRIHAWDPDEGINGQVRYGFTEKTEANHGDKFIIDSESGEIIVIGVLDFEDEKYYILTVTARDQQPNSVEVRATVHIRLIDLNDHAPGIDVKTHVVNGHLQVLENSLPDTFVAHITVLDPDADENGKFMCYLNSTLFGLDKMYETDFKLITLVSFDREDLDLYYVHITCIDKGTQAKNSSLTITIEITDTNDHPPVFSPSVIPVSVEEANELGASITTVTATDADIGINAQLTYTLVDDFKGIFSINSDTGEITSNVILDREQTRQINLTVIATDRGDPPRSGLAIVVIDITDVDDEIPQFSQNLYKFDVPENQPENTLVGQVEAIDNDKPPYNNFSYHIRPNFEEYTHIFSIDSRTGEIRTKTPLDREMKHKYELRVAAKSATSQVYVSFATVIIGVSDLNDNVPEILFPSLTNNTLIVDPYTVVPGQTIAQIKAFDRDFTNDEMTNSICEYAFLVGTPDIAINPENGTLFVKNDIESKEGEENSFKIIVHDCGQPSFNATAILNIHFERIKTPAKSYQKQNLITVIVICVVTLVIAVVLILFICRVMRNKRRLDLKYNWMARMADQRIRISYSEKNDLNRQTSRDEILASMEESDAVKVAVSLGFGFDEISDQRTIEGQESRPKERAETKRKPSSEAQRGPEEGIYQLSGHPEDNNYTPTYPLDMRFIYHTDHKVKKPAVFNPNPDQRPSPVDESESIYSTGDSGRGSADGSPPGAAWRGIADAGNQADIGSPSPQPAISTWDLHTGIHRNEGLRFPSTLSLTQGLSPLSTPNGTLDSAKYSRDRQPQVRFQLPPEVSSLASMSMSTCSDDCLNEKDI